MWGVWEELGSEAPGRRGRRVTFSLLSDAGLLGSRVGEEKQADSLRVVLPLRHGAEGREAFSWSLESWLRVNR